ncbi:hypothetical protein FQN49_002050 [Arthroderma sp. PD_2]|nr:hypothetical protein FQN49_002050 [Arthroderma sp. PD_2]
MFSKNLRRASLPVLVLLLQLQLVAASPFSTPQPTHSLAARECSPCGYYGQACCLSNEECTTDSNNQATCRPVKSGGGGQWEYFTTTYVQTDFVTVTSTGSRPISQPTGSQPQCKISIGETECGNTCCTAAQACNENLVCVQSGGSPFPTKPAPTPPTRPTSTEGVTVTASPTTTLPFMPAVGTDGSSVIGITKGSGGLSGGAIAGIVIGSIAGALILLFICICCCVGSCIDRVRGIFGLGGRRKRTRHSSYTGSSSYSSHHGWFGGGGGSRPDSEKKKKKTGFLGLASLGVIIGAIALCLGLGRRKDDKSTSYTGSSYYTYTTSSSSSSSSGRRTRRS